ncbi:MAG: rod shape-determining protein MreC [Phenylobacterium sp.]|uniref:rod shape-determining protein MreC n=1 Tax=Phenylobacterium sp. TaxID=1871053 RepID=UPI00301A1226
MSFRDNPFGEVRLPLLLGAAAAAVVALLVAFALLMADRRQTYQAGASSALRRASDQVVAPVTGALAAPVRWMGGVGQGITGYFFAVSENRRLKSELAIARSWREKAVTLADENARYRALLGLSLDPPAPMVTARAVSESRGPYANTRLINAGSERGVKVGHPVLTENGLAGRVIGVTPRVSRMLMLTDAASRTPVMIQRTRARAILTGDGGWAPELAFLRGRDAAKEGDLVLTSGDGGVLPRGLAVGRVVRGADGGWRVRLATDAAPIDYVRIVMFEDFVKLEDLRALSRPSPPPPPTPVSALPVPKPKPKATQAKPVQAIPTRAIPAQAKPPPPPAAQPAPAREPAA